MRSFFIGLLMGGWLLGGTLVQAETPSPTVQQAQEQLWNLQDQLADARYHLATLHLTDDYVRLQDSLRKVDPAREPQKVSELQAALAEVDRKRVVEQQRLQLNHRLIQVERSDDHAAIRSIRARLKGLH